MVFSPQNGATIKTGCLGNPSEPFLLLNGGYVSTTPNTFVSTSSFSINNWVNPSKQVGSESRVIDFGNGPASDNIILAISSGTSMVPYFQLYVGGKSIFKVMSSLPLSGTNWAHLVGTYDGSVAKLYLNSGLVGAVAAAGVPNAVIRQNAYIGKSNWAADGYSSAWFCYLQIYPSVLSAETVGLLFKQPAGSALFFSF